MAPVTPPVVLNEQALNERALLREAVRLLKAGMWSRRSDNRFGQRVRLTFCMPDMEDTDRFLERAEAALALPERTE